MSAAPLYAMLQQLRYRVRGQETLQQLSDRDLFLRFSRLRDETAFAMLVERHGSMVFRVAQRILRRAEDSEDVVQATFVVLARKGGTIVAHESFAGWLHTVARRLAQEAYSRAARRQACELALTPRHTDNPIDEVSLREAQAIVDEELAALPDKYRAPLVLCCLEGRTRDEAARQLGCSLNALKSRLEQGRYRLQHRLVKRGLTITASFTALILAEGTVPPSLSAALAGRVLQTALRCSTNAAVRDLPAAVAALVHCGLVAVPGTLGNWSFRLLLLGGLLAAIGGGLLSRTLSIWPAPAVDPVAAAVDANPGQAVNAATQLEGRIVLVHGMRRLAVLAPDGKGLIWMEEEPPEGEHVIGIPRLDRDGRRLAYLTNKPHRIWIKELGKPGPGFQTGVWGENWFWSPDNKHLVVAGREGEDKTWKHWLVDTSTREKKALRLPENHRLLDWSPDGTWFLTATWHDDPQKGSRLHRVHKDSLQVRDLCDARTIFGARIAPNGQRVAYVSVPDLFIIDATGGTPRQLTREQNAALADVVAWSPDGNHLLCSRQTGPEKAKEGEEFETSLVLVDVEGKQRQTIWREKGRYGPTGLRLGIPCYLGDWRAVRPGGGENSSALALPQERASQTAPANSPSEKGDTLPYRRSRDVIYGRKDGMALTLDVLAPRAKSNGLGVIWVLSESFRSGPELLQPELVNELLRRGYTVFAVTHSSTPTYTLPEIVPDIHQAVRYIRHHAAQFHIDPSRIGIMGQSAGGHLGLMVGASAGKGPLFPEPNPLGTRARDPLASESSNVQAVACWAAPTDFLNYGADGKTVFEHATVGHFRGPFAFRKFDAQSLAFVPVIDRQTMRSILAQVSPVSHVTAQSAPTLIIQGDADKNVPLQQGERMIEKLKQAGVPARLVTRSGIGHGYGTAGPQEMLVVADWFDQYLSKKE